MRFFFDYIIYTIIAVNIVFVILDPPNSAKDYESLIDETQKGYGSYSEYDLYNTSIHKDSLGLITYIISTDLAWIENDSSIKNYYLADGFRIQDFYEHTDLGTKLAIQKADYIKLSVLGDWLFLFKRVIYMLVGILILLFIKDFKKGRIFSHRTIIYLQAIGIITLLFGYLSPNKNSVLEYILRDYCTIPIKIINFHHLEIGNTLYILLGLFLLIIAYCFGRGNYLEKENDLTI